MDIEWVWSRPFAVARSPDRTTSADRRSPDPTPALLIANFTDEPDSLLRLDDSKRLLFTDVAEREGVARASQALLKFGAFFFDYDLDGRLDFLTCNGHLEPDIQLARPGQSYIQPAQLYRNTGSEPCFQI